MFPLAIYSDGRSGGTIRLYAENEDVQLTWKTKFDEAISFKQKSSQVFEASVVAKGESLTVGSSGGSHTYPPENQPIIGMITCATPFGRCVILTTMPHLLRCVAHQ